MHPKYGKEGGMGCPGQGALGWGGTAGENGRSGRMGCLGIWGSRVGWSTQEGWGAPPPSPAAWERAAELQRGSACGCREVKGLTGFGYPPLC